MATRFLLALPALLLLAPLAQASHMGMYAYDPVEHDDQGRSVEPDFAVTEVLGPRVENAVVDQDRDGVAVPDALLPQPFPGRTRHLAPGCTDDSGRRSSGLCGLYTSGAGMPAFAAFSIVPPRRLGVEGMSGTAAPGAFTPTKASQLRFLDARINLQVVTFGSHYVELNRKLDDAAVGVGTADPIDAVAGPSAVWAWYGAWQDKNGNGVIDANYHAAGIPNQRPALPDDEFVWFGNCLAYPGIPNPGSVANGFCAYDTEARAGRRTEMISWLFPGNHHATHGGSPYADGITCAPACWMPGDLPGRQAYQFLGTLGLLVCAEAGLGFGPLACGTTDPSRFDANDEARLGDPLLGPQGSVRADGPLSDYSGEPFINTRSWRLGLGWPTWFYDQSLLVRLVHVTGVGCERGADGGAEVGACRFTDVDRYEVLDPRSETLLQVQVKPAARSAWLLVRDGVYWTADGLRHNQRVPAAAAAGSHDDAAIDPGFSREPNDPRDAYPAARHNVRGCPPGEALHHGWCNDYAAHRERPRAFADAQPLRVGVAINPVGFEGCLLCFTSTAAAVPYAGEAPDRLVPVRTSGDHRRTLGPGEYLWAGPLGSWSDRPQVWDERGFDPLALRTFAHTFSAPPDGWVGNVVNRTGTWYYRGYSDERCTTDQGEGSWPHAWCHPFLDGALQDPQDYAGEHGEWRGSCPAPALQVMVAPDDGRWDVPVFVSRWVTLDSALDDLPVFDLVGMEDYTGSSKAILLWGFCSAERAGFVSDMLLLPAGNLHEDLTTSMSVLLAGEALTDVDAYAGWGA